MATLSAPDIIVFHDIRSCFMCNGRIVSSALQNIKSDYGFEIVEIYKQALIDYYHKDLPLIPKHILIPYDLGEVKQELENFLFLQLQRKISIHFPKNGEKKRLCNLALQNAKEALRLTTNQEENILRDLKALLGLQNIPYRIEVFDTIKGFIKLCFCFKMTSNLNFKKSLVTLLT